MEQDVIAKINNPTSIEKKLPLLQRPRRNRKSVPIRSLLEETRLHPSNFISPLFIAEATDRVVPISSMPDVFRFNLECAYQEIEELLTQGVAAVNLFCYIDEHKRDPHGSIATKEGNFLQVAIHSIKRQFGDDVLLIADIALDPFTDHGHDGVIDANGYVLNDSTIYILEQMALRAAEAGVDIISPSDMMDGRVGYLRKALDSHGFTDTGILSYAAKYASCLYGPFRAALDSTPKIGDKKSYQLPVANYREALRECLLDEKEGADMLLIKPAITSLDIISKVRLETTLPIGAYQVSGEYSMLKAAAEKGWIDFDKALIETLTVIKRAGADFIFTYAAKKASSIIRARS